MTDASRKPFDAIHGDYSFFQEHSTEAEADISAYEPHLRRLRDEGRKVRMLDFGSGDGKVTGELLSRVAIPTERLFLSLVEPDAGYLADAKRALAPFTKNPIRAWPELPKEIDGAFDLIISNNVLYYVDDIKETLSALLRALSSPGIFIASVAGSDNSLVEYTFPLFDLIGKTYPFWLAQDCESALAELGEKYEVEEVWLKLEFADSEEGRMKIARFLMGEDCLKIPGEKLLSGFDKHIRNGKIVMETKNLHLIVRR